jgi:hypothetical protein
MFYSQTWKPQTSYVDFLIYTGHVILLRYCNLGYKGGGDEKCINGKLHFEDRKGDRLITLSCVIGRYDTKIGGG